MRTFTTNKMIEDMKNQLRACDMMYNNLDNPQIYYDWLYETFHSEKHIKRALERMLKYIDSEKWLIIDYPEEYLRVM